MSAELICGGGPIFSHTALRSPAAASAFLPTPFKGLLKLTHPDPVSAPRKWVWSQDGQFGVTPIKQLFHTPVLINDNSEAKNKNQYVLVNSFEDRNC